LQRDANGVIKAVDSHRFRCQNVCALKDVSGWEGIADLCRIVLRN